MLDFSVHGKGDSKARGLGGGKGAAS